MPEVNTEALRRWMKAVDDRLTEVERHLRGGVPRFAEKTVDCVDEIRNVLNGLEARIHSLENRFGRKKAKA